MIRFAHHIQFVTITNLKWLPVLQNDYHKQIIIEALQHRVTSQQVTIYAFIIVPNHFHAIWQLHDGIDKVCFQRDLLKFTARSILKFMLMNDDSLLQQLKVIAPDRKCQVWERNSLSIDLWNQKVFEQKLNYIHNNPLQEKWRLASTPAEYKYSSAKFYESGEDEFGLLQHLEL